MQKMAYGYPLLESKTPRLILKGTLFDKQLAEL